MGRFSQKKIPSETWTHPPTSIVISDFLNFFFAKPLKSRRPLTLHAQQLVSSVPPQYIYNRLPVLQISIFRSSSQYIVAASGQRRPAKLEPCISYSQRPHAALTVWCVRRHTWPTLEHPRVSTCREHAQCHTAGDSVSPTACGGDLPQEVSQV